MFQYVPKFCGTVIAILTICSPFEGRLTDSANGSTSVQNANPNYAKIQDYGRIEWHGGTARLVAGSSRPLHFVAMTLSTCLGVSVNFEDPHYRFLGDLLDVTAPQWAAQHPDDHLYAAKPGKVDITFNVTSDGSPADLPKLLQEAAEQVNQQQSYGYRVQVSGTKYRPIYSFVSTTSHNEKGALEPNSAYLDQTITISRQTAPLDFFIKMMTDQLTAKTGQNFGCCQNFRSGPGPSGGSTITYEATNESARAVLEDLMGEAESYDLLCEPMDRRFCSINVHSDMTEIPERAPQSGVCTAFGFDGYPPTGMVGPKASPKAAFVVNQR